MSARFSTVQLQEISSPRTLHGCEGTAPLVLVVDDYIIIADTLAAILREEGYAAMSAYDAESARALAELAPPDLLLSDIDLPGMDGVHLACWIRNDAPQCEVILFSAPTGNRNLPQDVQHRGRDFKFLAKPISPNTLLKEVARSLHLSPNK